MTESECLELAKKHGAGTEREWSSQAKVWFNKPQLTDYTNAAIEQATEDKDKCLELISSIFSHGDFISETYNERELQNLLHKLGYATDKAAYEKRRARLAELTKGE